MKNTQTKKYRIAMAGGGTGGHVFPIKSLIDYVVTKEEYVDKIESIIWFGANDSLEHTIFKRTYHTRNGPKFGFQSILSGKFRRETYIKSHLKNIRDIFLFIGGIFQSLWYLQKYHIDTIFCKGGYVALPVVIAGWLSGRKIVVHESDTHPGLVNRIASIMANKSFTGFDNVFKKAENIGQILSDDLLFDGDISNYNEIKDILDKTDITKTFVLVVGGSQGSQRLYQSLVRAIQTDKTLQTEFEFFVVLGLLNKDLAKDFEGFDNVHTFEFVSQKEMGVLCTYCDLALTRAGTTSLAEQKLFDMKLLIVPIAWTHDQYQNAQRYQEAFDDIFLDQKDEDFLNKLVSELKKLKGFKKEITTKNKSGLIHAAKDKVWEALLHDYSVKF